MKKKILSVLLCLCMVMALLPTTALAEVPSTAPTTIYICGMPLTDGDCLTDNDATSATPYTSGGYVALYQDGILHLNGLKKSFAGVANGNRALNWNYYDLVIELAEGSDNTLVDRNYAAINGASGAGLYGPSLTIQGKGTLNVTGGTNGIWVWEDVVIQNGATVNVTGKGTTNTGGTYHAGICTNTSGHGLIIKPGTTVRISGEGYGVSADNDVTGLLTVLGGNLVIRGKTAALHNLTSDFAGNTVYASNNFDGSSSVALDNPTALTSYKYISLSGFSNTATTYFTHAYDVQRKPPFPTKNQTITLWGLDHPFLSDGTQGSQNTGSWKLIKAGTYSYMKSNSANSANSANLDSIVADVVSNYTGLNRDAVVIHELKDGDTHIAYGVVVAYDAANGNAVFLGDSLSGGAGYLLATGERSGTIYATASEVATDYVQTSTYAISLDVDENDVYAFDPVTKGYAALIPKVVTVTNTGTEATGDLTVALSGSGASSFTLSKTSISSLAVSGRDTFTVVPNTELAAGTYTATVTVSGTNVGSHAFDVSFTVRPVGAYIITFDPNGGSVTPIFDFTGGSGNLSSLPTPTRSSYTFNGWYTAASGGTKVDTNYVFADDTTIYAQWAYIGGSSSSSSGGSYTPPTYKVESAVSKDADGSVSFSQSNAKKGDTVTITVTPDRYYKVDGVVVKDSSSKKIAVTDNGDGTFTFTMPASKVTVEPTFSWDNPFVDVAENAYYAPAVEWALKNDITNGTGDGTTFSPDAGCTRAQIVTFLWKAAGCPEPASANSFTDVFADAYYAKAVAWAVEQGITNGTGGGKFSPDAICSRSQSMAFLYHAAGSPEVFDDIVFSDVAASSYYADAVVWAVQNDITNGTGNGRFSPGTGCTRGQIMTFLYRWLTK